MISFLKVFVLGGLLTLMSTMIVQASSVYTFTIDWISNPNTVGTFTIDADSITTTTTGYFR